MKYDRDRTQLVGLRTEIVTGLYYAEMVRKNSLYCGSKMHNEWNDKKGQRRQHRSEMKELVE